jgi:hypothetical protein
MKRIKPNIGDISTTKLYGPIEIIDYDKIQKCI